MEMCCVSRGGRVVVGEVLSAEWADQGVGRDERIRGCGYGGVGVECVEGGDAVGFVVVHVSGVGGCDVVCEGVVEALGAYAAGRGVDGVEEAVYVALAFAIGLA